jgi:hypothetical protein
MPKNIYNYAFPSANMKKHEPDAMMDTPTEKGEKGPDTSSELCQMRLIHSNLFLSQPCYATSI